MDRALKIGDSIRYVDSKARVHNALVTVVWPIFGGGNAPNYGCNLVYVAGEEDKTDPYGRQLERATSVCHKSAQPAPGNFWAWSDEI